MLSAYSSIRNILITGKICSVESVSNNESKFLSASCWRAIESVSVTCMVIESDGMAIVILSDTISFVILSFCSMTVVANTPVTERRPMRIAVIREFIRVYVCIF